MYYIILNSYKIPTGECESLCRTGQYVSDVVGKKCTSCESNCASCTSTTVCTGCDATFLLKE